MSLDSFVWNDICIFVKFELWGKFRRCGLLVFLVTWGVGGGGGWGGGGGANIDRCISGATDRQSDQTRVRGVGRSIISDK